MIRIGCLTIDIHCSTASGLSFVRLIISFIGFHGHQSKACTSESSVDSAWKGLTLVQVLGVSDESGVAPATEKSTNSRLHRHQLGFAHL